MSYWGSRGISVDSFEGYDPTPYSGGYDLSLTYGRPLPPSDEICYPVFAAGCIDLDRPHYSSASQSDSYGRGFLRPGFQLQPHPFPNTLNPTYQTFAQFPEHGSGYGLDHGQFTQPQEFRPGSGYGHYQEQGFGGIHHYGDEYQSTDYRNPSYSRG